MPRWRADGLARSWAESADTRCSATPASGWRRRKSAIPQRWRSWSPRDFVT